MSFALSAGPPAAQVEQLAALLEAGIVEDAGERLVAPQTQRRAAV